MDFYLHICNDIVTVVSPCYLAHYTLDVGYVTWRTTLLMLVAMHKNVHIIWTSVGDVLLCSVCLYVPAVAFPQAPPEGGTRSTHFVKLKLYCASSFAASSHRPVM